MEIDSRDREYNEITPALDSSNVAKKRKKDSPSPIALEPCSGNKAAVLSLLVRMPTGESEVSLPFLRMEKTALGSLAIRREWKFKYLISDYNFHFNALERLGRRRRLKLMMKTVIDYRFSLSLTGGLSHSPAGQAAGLSVASALVTLGNPRRPSIDLNPKDTNKSKRKQSQHPDNL